MRQPNANEYEGAGEDADVGFSFHGKGLDSSMVICVYTHVIETMSSPVTPSCLLMKPSLISDEAIELVAHRFAILGEPMRLRLLRALFDGEKNVSALVELTAGSQANISRHLQYLATAGLAGRRKEGLEVFYSIADSSIFKLCELVCGSLEKQLIKQAGAFGTGPNR